MEDENVRRIIQEMQEEMRLISIEQMNDLQETLGLLQNNLAELKTLRDESKAREEEIDRERKMLKNELGLLKKKYKNQRTPREGARIVYTTEELLRLQNTKISRKEKENWGKRTTELKIRVNKKTEGQNPLKHEDLQMGTWNIRSINGKELELSNEFEKANLDILVVTETKKKGKGILELENGHILIWSGVKEDQRAAAGVGCILHNDAKNQISKWEAISERILTVELKYKTHTKTIIAVYGPNEDEKADKKDSFWEELTLIMETIKGKIYVAGDFNGRVGSKDATYATVVGNYGEAKRNNNGIRLLDFCLGHDLIITNTYYKHKEIHKYTRAEPSRKEKSLIDYILVERENRTTIQDVRVKRGSEINSDHHLLVATIKENENDRSNNITKEVGKAEHHSIRTYKLKNKEVAKIYERAVSTKLEKVKRDTKKMNIEEKWKILKNSLVESATEVCGTSKTTIYKKQTSWWTDEIKQQVKNKKKQWLKYLSSKIEVNYQLYKEQRKTVKKLVKEAKEKSWEDFGTKLEKDSQGNQKLFYKVLKNLRSNKNPRTITIKNADGELLREEREIMGRWKEYFENLLNTETPTEESDQNKEDHGNRGRNTEGNEIKMEELKEAIQRLKNGKAPGNDKITTEMVKNMGEEGRQFLLEILNKIWEEEKIPSDWELGLIVPIFKKGDNKDCNNYRGITLLSTINKIYEHILEKRLRLVIEPKLIESQSGFRKGRSTQDHVFTIKEIINKSQMSGKTTYLAFVDMEKAFDRIPRVKIWESLRKKNVDEKLIGAVKSLYKETKNCVISNNRKSDIFTTKNGVRQGGGLSPLLFITYMDEITREARTKTKSMHIGHLHLEPVEITECAFADDIALIARTEKDLQDNLTNWNETLLEHGMKMNKNKTKVMVISRDKRELHIQLEGVAIEQVTAFQYLGVTFEETGKQHTEINNRIEKANKVYYAMSKGFINKKEIRKQTKMKVFRAIYRPILTYGCESWVLTQPDRNRIQASEMKYLRRVKGITRRDRIRNVQVREELKSQPVAEFIEQRQLGWWGHLHRMSDNRPVKRIWETKTALKKRRGRPRETWDDVIRKILTKKGKSVTEAKMIARNRKEWTKFVKCEM